MQRFNKQLYMKGHLCVLWGVISSFMKIMVCKNYLEWDVRFYLNWYKTMLFRGNTWCGNYCLMTAFRIFFFFWKTGFSYTFIHIFSAPHVKHMFWEKIWNNIIRKKRTSLLWHWHQFDFFCLQIALTSSCTLNIIKHVYLMYHFLVISTKNYKLPQDEALPFS